ncbi:MAG: hypothetical protein IID37_01395 [Planctomycetes bacterium]|nr:hypothetical protein [Planctomycetota bacterium]
MSRSGISPLVKAVSILLPVVILGSLLELVVNSPSTAFGDAQPGPEGQPKAARIVEFAPGVRIDWPRHRVEIEGMVVLRDGPLELFACTQGTREHESIVVVRPRALHVYQAMGMLGLEPGEPSRYDEKTEKMIPPTGEALSVQVRVDGQPTAPIEAWMWDIEHDRPLGVTNWVFCGSRSFDGGRFGADLDGTVVCVVDFDTALIAPGASHSADNEALWLRARSDRIPERGTRCVILIEKLQQTTLSVEVGAAGELLLDGQATDAADLAAALQARSAAERLSRIHLTVRDGAERTLVQRIEADLAKLGLADRLVRSVGRRGSDSTRTDPPD